MTSKNKRARGQAGTHVETKTTNQRARRKSTTSRRVLKSRSTGSEVQREKILVLLRQGAKTTLDFRDHGIMMPATRVFELKRAGHTIQTELVPLFDAHGFKHEKCARYRLVEGAE